LNFITGKNLLERSDCKTCHNPDKVSIGPSYKAIAERYKGKNVVDTLAQKIITGGNGNWGQNVMAAHPQHSIEETAAMVEYILSLASQQKSLPASGTVAFAKSSTNNFSSSYILRAVYKDRGGPVVGSLTSSKMVVFKNPRVDAEEMKIDKKMSVIHPDGTDITIVGGINNGSYLILDSIDLTGISSVEIAAVSLQKGSVVEAHLDNASGPLIAQANLPVTDQSRQKMLSVRSTIKAVTGKHDLYFVFRSNAGMEENVAYADYIKFSKK
jgi:cytochrome c